jgi:hypothetical protein
MNPFEMVVSIIFLVVVAGIINNLIRARSERAASLDDSRGEAADLRDQILTLEERIRVLERIVTDTSGRENLRRQFRDLER